ncbi:MAG: triose-phosphate isomerase [Candidatus Bathyarchaeia archaeon]|nr:triose-phosphate isomerase [Candidatus Bathyarchaeota archaeon]
MSKVKLPMILINFKAYAEAIGERAVKLSELAEKVSSETNVCVCVAPQFVDIPVIARRFNVPVFAQHIDPITHGSYTGYVLPEAVKQAGAVGSLINHSERKLALSDISAAVARAREVGLISVVCSESVAASTILATLKPDMIAIEPPELIGTGVAVSKAKPEIITSAIKAVKRVNPEVSVLCGAGITSGSDVEAAIRLGVEGVLISSSLVKAKDPYKVMLELAEAILSSKG